MFEPRACAEQSEAQAQLVAALERRDLALFKELLARPDVDPDHWYGRPYKGTCLMIACSTPGGEPFAVELIKAGASRRSFPRHSTLSLPTSPTMTNDHVDGNFDAASVISADHQHKPFVFDVEQLLNQGLRTLSAGIENVKYQNEKILQEQQSLEYKQNSLKKSVEEVIVNTKEHLQKNETYFDEFRQKLNEFETLLLKVEETENQNNILLNQILENLKKNAPD